MLHNRVCQGMEPTSPCSPGHSSHKRMRRHIHRISDIFQRNLGKLAMRSCWGWARARCLSCTVGACSSKGCGTVKPAAASSKVPSSCRPSLPDSSCKFGKKVPSELNCRHVSAFSFARFAQLVLCEMLKTPQNTRNNSNNNQTVIKKYPQRTQKISIKESNSTLVRCSKSTRKDPTPTPKVDVKHQHGLCVIVKYSIYFPSCTLCKTPIKVSLSKSFAAKQTQSPKYLLEHLRTTDRPDISDTS